MIIQETEQVNQEIINESDVKIENVAVGRVEDDGSKLCIGTLKTQNESESQENVKKPLGLYAYKNNNDQLFGLTGNTLAIGGKPIEISEYTGSN
jgi:hypothetical protein